MYCICIHICIYVHSQPKLQTDSKLYLGNKIHSSREKHIEKRQCPSVHQTDYQTIVTEKNKTIVTETVAKEQK